MINKTIAPGGFAIIHSNPSDINDAPASLPSDVTWAQDGGLGTLTLIGVLNQNAKFDSNGHTGTALITMACQGKQAQVTISVVAPVVPPFDHFSPFFED